MPKLKLEPPAEGRPRHFIGQWRVAKDLSQEELADLIGQSRGNIWQLEAGEVGYTQAFLEAAARALDCSPLDLISREPGAPLLRTPTSEEIADLELGLAGVLTKLVSQQRPIHEWPGTLSAAVLTWLSRPGSSPPSGDSGPPKSPAGPTTPPRSALRKRRAG